MSEGEARAQPIHRHWRDLRTWLVIVLAIAGIVTNLTPGGHLQKQAGPLVRRLWGPPRVRDNDYIARLFHEAGSGNLFVLFKHADRSDPSHRQRALMLYFRGNYVRHPDRLWVTADAVPLTNGAAILEHNHRPDDNWLRAHGVRQIAVIDLRHLDQAPKLIPLVDDEDSP